MFLFTLLLTSILLVSYLVLWPLYARDDEDFGLECLPGSGIYVALRDRF